MIGDYILNVKIVRLAIKHKIKLLSDNCNTNSCFYASGLAGLGVNLSVCIRYGFRSAPKTTYLNNKVSKLSQLL